MVYTALPASERAAAPLPMQSSAQATFLSMSPPNMYDLYSMGTGAWTSGGLVGEQLRGIAGCNKAICLAIRLVRGPHLAAIRAGCTSVDSTRAVRGVGGEGGARERGPPSLVAAKGKSFSRSAQELTTPPRSRSEPSHPNTCLAPRSLALLLARSRSSSPPLAALCAAHRARRERLSRAFRRPPRWLGLPQSVIWNLYTHSHTLGFPGVGRDQRKTTKVSDLPWEKKRHS